MTYEEERRGGFEFVEGVKVITIKPINKQASLLQQSRQTEALESSSQPSRKEIHIHAVRGSTTKKPTNKKKKTAHDCTFTFYNLELFAHLKGQHWILHNFTKIPPGAVTSCHRAMSRCSVSPAWEHS